VAGGEVAVHAEAAPVAHDLFDVVGGERWLCAERMTAQVDEFAAVGGLRQHETVAPGAQRVGRIERVRVLAIQPHGETSMTG
jgi:hypothetical protein